MRAIFGALSLLTICSAETLSWDKNDDVGKQEKFSKNKFLVATHHPDNAPSPGRHWDNVSSSTVASIPNASTPKTIASNYFSKVLSKKRRKSLKKERSKLRSTLKKIKHDKAARTTVLKRIREINDEIKNHQNDFKSHRKTNKKQLAQKDPRDKNTTPRNKDVVFKWSLKNNSSSSKVINKPNHQQNSKSEHSNSFKVRREGVISKNNVGTNNISDSTENEVTTPTYDEIINYKAMSIVRASNSPTIDLEQIESDNYFVSNVENMTTAKESNGFSKINYAKLLQIQSTTVPPIKNISLNVILREFNAISDQIVEMFPGAKTYPKFEMSKAPVRKIATRCSVMKGGCEHICHPKGPKKCSCLSGFKLSPNKRSCIDIDECHHKNGGCSQTCNNTPGSHYCGCLPGLRLSENKRSCEDINECLLRNGHGPCQDTCENIHGSYKCSCTGLNGTHLGKDKHSCEDVNECLDGQSGCSHGCVNTLGRAYCTCPDGMELGSDWKTCNDINECESKEIQKLCSNGCLNTVGSFRCVENYELQNDQTAFPVPDEIACPPLFPPKHGFLDCSRKKGLSVKMKSKSGRRRVTNRPGTFCKLVCPIGYRNVGVFKTTCGFDGQWIGDNWGKCEHFPHPSLKCPESQTVHLKKDEESVLVTFNAPKSNVDWEHVTADPEWAKALKGYLHQGYHWLTFSVTDPRTELNATCSFVVNIKKHTF